MKPKYSGDRFNRTMNRAEKQASAKVDAYKALLELQHSFTDFLERYLNYQCRNELPEERSITQNVPLDRLDREPSRQENLDNVLFIKRQIEVSLPNESLLKDVLEQLWKYFLFNHREQEATLTSHNHEQEWQEDTLSSRSIVADCKTVIHILQRNTRLMEISENIGSPEDLNQPLSRILNYLKNRSIKPRKSEVPTSDEENRLLKELTESPGCSCYKRGTVPKVLSRASEQRLKSRWRTPFLPIQTSP